MSAGARAGVLPGLSRPPTTMGRREPAGRSRVRVITFAALGLYGVLRWATLFSPAPTWRLLGLLALALALVVAGPWLAGRHWALALAAAALALLALFPICGVPLAWMRHARIALIADGISQGLSSLPAVLLPYNGINPWTHVVILLGAGVLLVDAAVCLGFAGSTLSDARRAGAALPLVALAVVPSTLLHPEFPYLQGLLLFALLAAFMWAERIPRADRAAVIGLCALVGGGAMILAPGVDRHHPWVNPQNLAGGLAPAGVDTFDWSQSYGPVVWPRRGRTVLDVSAARADYWKAENLDVFDGREWTAGTASSASPLTGVDPRNVQLWTQPLQVTVRTMRIATILAAGAAPRRPQNVSGPVFAGSSPGTWIAGNALSPGDSYRVSVYDPRPTPRQLSRAGVAYPAEMAPYLTIELPSSNGYGPPTGARFPAFHSGLPVLSGPFLSDANGAGAVAGSPYGQAYQLAQRLSASAATPYAFVAAVVHYLSAYTYNEAPPRSEYPLESFLFQSKIGYCQQFAGAMALLLRMGGVPARVAAGFTSGTYDAAQHVYAVSDVDAHAWVEAWFPHYGWVRFDATPPADPALGGRAPITSSNGLGTAASVPQSASTAGRGASGVAPAPAGHGSGGPPALLVLGFVAAGVAVAALMLLVWRAGRARGIDQLVAELERAMARTGQPIGAATTLAGLEHRVRGRPEAEAYIRTIRLARFGNDGPGLPTLRQRRALRTELRSGLGLAGTLRALWALPPRWTAAKRFRAPVPGPKLSGNGRRV